MSELDSLNQFPPPQRDSFGRAGAMGGPVVQHQVPHQGHHLVQQQQEFLESFNADQYDRDDLPMLIWLRGDEPICSEFTLDAEAVMAELGIKRSRLTQIAGKEIRVGRLRVGRYVRPVFRPEDVSAYKGWVRASASHLKSSRAIEDAAAKLEHETSNLAHKVVDAASAKLEQLDERLLTLHQTSQRLFADFAAEVRISLDATSARSSQLETTIYSRDRELSEGIGAFMRQVQAQNEVIHSALAGLAGMVQSQKIEMSDFGKQLVLMKKNLEDLQVDSMVQLKLQGQEILDAVSRKPGAKASRTTRRSVAPKTRNISRGPSVEGPAHGKAQRPRPALVSRRMRRATGNGGSA